MIWRRSHDTADAIKRITMRLVEEAINGDDLGVIDVVRDGKMAESRIIMDTIGMMKQLEVIPG